MSKRKIVAKEDSRFTNKFEEDSRFANKFQDEDDDDIEDNNQYEDDDDDQLEQDGNSGDDESDYNDDGENGQDDEENEEEDVNNENTDGDKKDDKKIIIKPMDKEKIEKLKRDNENKGIIYLASIPPKMKPAKLKQLLLKHGKVNRMYLVRANVDRKNHRNDMFKEGWVEFNDKAIARKTATILNNQVMGGKSRDIHKDCLWNLRYLPKFKWHHLQDKLISQRMERDKKLKLEISQVRKQNAALLEQVEKSKYINQKLETKNKQPNNKVVRTFKQRETHEDKAATISNNVLNKMVTNKKQKLDK